MFYERVFRALNRAKVRYVVVGGMALNLHGIPRVTHDLDLLPDLVTTNLEKLVSELTSLGFKPRLPVAPEQLCDEAIRDQWIKEKSLVAFTFTKNNGLEEIDILITSPVSFKHAEKYRVIKRAGNLRIPLISVADLITMKSEANRSVDQWDIRMLKKLKKDTE